MAEVRVSGICRDSNAMGGAFEAFVVRLVTYTDGDGNQIAQDTKAAWRWRSFKPGWERVG